LIHILYCRQEFSDCLLLIEEQLKECKGLCEYALYVKGLIKRSSGHLQESLSLFQAATMISPHNVANLKQVGRALFLLGKFKAAIDIYEEARNHSEEDWELAYHCGNCYVQLKNYEKAESEYLKANVIQRHDCTYMALGKLYTVLEKYAEAIETYLEALEYSPENTDLLTTVGLLYLRTGENFKAFDYLGNAMTVDARNPKTILAAGSIMQDHSDFDVALTKYRVAAVLTPNSAQLWNNIGMCFFGKKNFIAAISCLRRALYLAPFEWIMAYNLGIVFLHTEQYASAFHYLSAAVNLKPDFGSSYVYLAVALSRLDDIDNACSAYEKAISMEIDHVFELNYAITLYNSGAYDESKLHLKEFEKLWGELDEESKKQEAEAQDMAKQLSKALQQCK
jgi:Bardet-Biedl syndrome 4 protein